ncbi:TonB-dependent receptor [Flavobacterium sp. SE-s27]|uniref:TonB-dependent receptor n=1 Tax=Flavobacterium solisilvae TaxID=1852019 RepID=A0ABX1QWR6_9FLAO|nr:TonB-dependent receptor [Flavobacterium solisilvae]
MRDLFFRFCRKTKSLKGLTTIILLCSVASSMAQSKISGTVTDDKGLTLPAVTVAVKGGNNSVVTDMDGKYQIVANSDATLVFSFIGFATKEVQVNGKNTIDVKLSENVEGLKEVVVIGYGSQKKSDVNSAISSIKSEDIKDLKQVSFDQMLQGKVAGVSVSNGSGQPGAAANVRVRGTTSISGTNEPLYIIDGVPVSGDATGRATSGRPIAGNDFSSSGGTGNVAASPLSLINPNDIESIDVLKDASATAIYGSRGANGVIIVTTKSGKKGNGKIVYDGFTSVTTISKRLDVLNLREYAQYQNDLAVLFGQPLRPDFSHPELLGNGTDWQDEVYQTAIAKNHNVSFSGNSNGTNYYISGGFLDQQGNIIGSGYKRYTAKVNVDGKVKDWIKVGTSINAGVSNEDITVNQSYVGLITNTLLQAPDVPVRTLDGDYAAPPMGQNVAYFNPVAEALIKKNKLIRKNFMGNAFAEITILKGLRYRVDASANTEFSENTEFTPSYDRGSQVNLTADLTERRQNWYSTNISNVLTYDFSVNKHKFTVLAGQEANQARWEGIIANAQDFKTNDIYTLNMGNPDLTNAQSYKGSQALYSLFGRVIYDFDNRYGFSASIRQDVSSKFDPTTNNQKGYFPAFTVSWKLSNEKFMESTKQYIDNIKIRLGYGETGNQQIPNNLYSANLGAQSDSFLPSNYANPNLVWESMNQTNFGLDFTTFNSKLGVTLDLYKKVSKDFLFQVPLPDYLTGGDSFLGGISAPFSNIGEVQNTGFDLSLNFDTKSSSNFNWTSNLIISKYKNRVNEIVDGLPLTQEVNTNGFLPVTVTNTLVGQPIGMFWGYKTDGLFTSVDQFTNAPAQFGQTFGSAPGQTYLGDVKYVDVNNDGAIDERDKTVIGNPHPDFTFGFTNTFRYKNFDLSVFLQGSVGNDIMNLTYRNGTSNSQLYQNALTDALNYWTVDNPNTNIPRPIGALSNTNLEISDRYVEDGSYVRIQNVTLGYSLPSSLISKAKLSRVKVYASAQNLFTFTKYSGYDPEIGSLNQNVLLSGIDNGRYPSPRTFSFGLNVEF